MVDGLAFNDMDLFGRELDDPIAELEQDIWHMLLEAYGTNPDARERGIGIEDALSGSDLTGLRRRIEDSIGRDSRVTAVAANLSFVDAAEKTILVEIKIQADEQELGIALQFDGQGRVVRVDP
jgi:hypothetical protein